MLIGLFGGAAFSLILVFFSNRWGLLSKSGAVTTVFIGTIIFGLGGWRWSPAVLFFFFSSGVLSKLGRTKKLKLADVFQKGEKRDWAQVLANGFIPAMCTWLDYLFPQPVWYIFYLASLSSATADTWGTELGVLSESEPILITTGKRVPAGTSGGITLAGTLASLAGVFCLCLVGIFFWPAYALTSSDWMMLSAVGLAAAFFDSLLGATLQSQYVCNLCGKKTERRKHCSKDSAKISGLGWMTNDWVNFLSSLFAVTFSFLLIKE